jgi:ligand-binding sensor domain-containing protein/signal transduction histidine kinase/DNA-binding response OmpR family regulator
MMPTMFRTLSFFFLCWFITGAAGIPAIGNEVTFRHITDKDGLYYNWIWDIYKDSEGYLWFSSQEGAFRYDGTGFETFKVRSTTGFPYLKIHCVFEDNSGFIWFGTNEGLVRFDRVSNEYERVLLDQAGGPASNLVNDIKGDSNGVLWLATGHGLISFTPATGGLVVYSASDSPNSLNTNVMNELLLDSKNNLWIGGNNGDLYQFIPHNDYFLHFRNPANQGFSGINALYEDHQGYLWVGYEGAGVARFNTWTKEYVRHYVNSGEPGQIASNLVRGIVESNNHTIWFGTEKGLSILNQETDQFSTVTSSFDNRYGLNDNAIYSLFKEDNGDIWVGTFFGGVNVFHNRPRFIQTHLPDGSSSRISGKAIGPIIQDGDVLWVGTEDNGLNRFRISDNYFEHFTRDNSGLSYDNIHALCRDHLGNLWAGTYTGGLNLLKPGAKSFVHFRHSDDPRSISNNSIYRIYNDSDNNLWIGTRGGLNRYNYGNGTFERVHGNVLGGQFIWDIEEDRQGNIWVCTFGQGVFILNKGKGFQLQHVPMPVQQTITLLMRENGEMLIGTEKQGLIIYDPDSGTQRHLTLDDGLPDNTIYGIVEDNSHSVWLTTNNGLVKTRDFESFEVFTVYDGLPTNRFNYNSAARVNGKLYFGSTQGLVIVDPELQVFEEYVPRLHLSAIDFPDNEAEGSGLGRTINYMEELSLDPGLNSFSVSYSGVNLRDGNKVRYAVFMDGVDKEWDFVGGNRVAKYNNLDPGRYVFRVRTVDKVGGLQDNEKALAIMVQPRWYGTMLAKTVFAGVGLAICIVILVLLYTRAKVKIALRIEKMEKQKIKDINDAKIEFFTNISHEFKTPLTLIQGPINRLIKDEGITREQKEWYLSLIKKNGERLLHLINELLGFRNAGRDMDELRLENADIREILDNVSESFIWIAEANGINFTCVVDDSVSPACLDVIKLEKVLNNLLINAFSNTPKDGFISVEAYLKGANLVINIKNSGKGIPSDVLKKIFERNFSSNGNGDLNQGTGIGLAYTKNLVELHKGSIDVYSLENVETTFVVKIPVDLQASLAGSNGEYLSLNACKCPEGVVLHNGGSFLPPGHRPTILVAEDVKELRDFLKDTLDEKFKVLTAANGLEAFKMAQAENPDIIVSDIMMPKLNGYELCSKIKNTFTTSHIRVVLLTVLSEDQDKLIGYKSGADAFISKPFEIELLISRIENLLKDSHVLKQKFQQDLDVTLEEITYSNPDEELLKGIFETVNTHLSDVDFDVNRFAQEIGLSKSTLYRKMKSITGLSANKFVQVVRLKKAARLLKETEMGISEIAYEVGFNDPYYFSRAFKENFGVSPKKYRETFLSSVEQ